jgi:UDP-N-acetylglucosamine transferase subunit ALG13
VIFVTLGTQAFPFDRLLRTLESLPGAEELVIQCARSSFRPARATWHDDLPHGELVELIRRARAIVCHAGVGSVLTALQEGRRPIVVPRLREYGEAVDDHQVMFARRLAVTGRVILIEDLEELAPTIAGEQQLAQEPMGGRGLVDDIGAYLDELVPRRDAR